MITPPIRRVETPQLVVLQKASSPASSWNLMFWASAKLVPEEVRGAGLQRLAVLHHGFDGIGVHRAGEALILRLLAGDHRHRQHRLRQKAR